MAIITLINFCSEIHVVGKLGLYFALIQGQLSVYLLVIKVIALIFSLK